MHQEFPQNFGPSQPRSNSNRRLGEDFLGEPGLVCERSFLIPSARSHARVCATGPDRCQPALPRFHSRILPRRTTGSRDAFRPCCRRGPLRNTPGDGSCGGFGPSQKLFYHGFRPLDFTLLLTAETLFLAPLKPQNLRKLLDNRSKNKRRAYGLAQCLLRKRKTSSAHTAAPK